MGFSPTPPWRPLLTGPDADAARQLVDSIADTLARAVDSIPTPWEAALFFGYRALATGSDDDRRLCSRLLQRSRSALPQVVFLVGGLSGLGWALAHLQSLGLVDGHGKLLDSIDRALGRYLTEAPDTFDLVSGLAGIAVYAAERQQHSLLGATVAWFDALAVRQPPGLHWFTPPEQALPSRPPQGYIDLGVAHGVPGVLPALALASRLGVQAPLAAELHQQALDFLLDQPLEPLTFPSLLAPPAPPRPGPFAWCYGDAGVAAVLLATAPPGSPASPLGQRLALAGARRDPAAAGVRFAGICHGSAGLAHIFARLAQNGDPTFTAAALRCYRLTFQKSHLVGKPEHGDPDTALDASLLEGASGVGLALLAGLAPIAPAWDRPLGLSLL